PAPFTVARASAHDAIAASGVCESCGQPMMTALEADVATYVYALGRIEPRFPTPAVEKELAQVIGQAQTTGMTDAQALQSVLSDRANRYLARSLCWVLRIEGLDTYILIPRDPLDLDLLVEALRPAPRATDVDVIIGLRAGLAPPELCDGLIVP